MVIIVNTRFKATIRIISDYLQINFAFDGYNTYIAHKEAIMVKTYIVSVRGKKQRWSCYEATSVQIVLYNFEKFASDCKLVFDSKTKELLNPGDFPFLSDAELVREAQI